MRRVGQDSHVISVVSAGSAFKDRRFDPLKPEELPLLSCAVSLLVKYEEGAHAYVVRLDSHPSQRVTQRFRVCCAGTTGRWAPTAF